MKKFNFKKINIKEFLITYFVTDKCKEELEIKDVCHKHDSAIAVFTTLAVAIISMLWISMGYLRPYFRSSEDFIYNTLYADSEPDESKGKPININKAGKTELVEIEGIGEKLADRILNYRYENGDFESIYDLLEVEGLSRSTLEKIMDKITL